MRRATDRRRGRPVRSSFRLQPLRDLAGALCTFLFLLGPARPACADEAKPLSAMLLVARPELPDFSFRDSIVLVMNNLGHAPAGLIVNRPTQIGVSHLFPELERLAQLQDKLYFGGPVEIESVWFLFRADAPPEHAVKACDGVYLSANRELLLKLLDRDKPMDGLRIFIGHSGWAPGQLQAEIARGDWTLAPAESDRIFNGKSDRPWPGPQGPGAGRGT
jgi:putative transcriptional regulator